MVRAVVLVLALMCAAPAAAATPPGPLPPQRDQPDPSIADGSAQRALDSARARWRDAGIHNYRFKVAILCFCPLRRSPVLFVRDDKPVKPRAPWRAVATVRRLQHRVQDAIDGEVAGLSVRYDARGIPRRIAIDNFANAADDEVTYEVRRFWRGTRGRGGPSMP